MNTDEYRKRLEHEILQIIEDKLKKGLMDANRARAIAQMVLAKLHPPLTLEQIHVIAPTLDDEFTELSLAVLPVMADHEEKTSKTVAEHAEKLIKSGKIEEALSVLKSTDN
jgi:hypothetical protein